MQESYFSANHARALITGATGFVGSHLVDYLHSQFPGMELRLATRRQLDCLNLSPTVLPSTVIKVVGDINPHTDWTDALTGVDLVIHLAARVHVMSKFSSNSLIEYRNSNTLATTHLAREAASAGVRRFIYLSSVKVNGEKTDIGEPYSEDSIPNPMDPYAISKWEAELGLKEICMQTGMEFVVIRPPLIYGPGVKANFKRLMSLIAMGLPLPFGSIRNRRSMLSLGNLVSFIAEAITNPLAANECFLLSDGIDLSTPELLTLLAKGMDREVILLPIPPFALMVAAQVLGISCTADRLLGSLQIESGKARQLLSWHPPLSLEEGITLAAKDYLNSTSS